MPDSIGNKLKAARESRRLTLDQAADATRIRVIYLQGLEHDDYSVMLSAAQGRGFLRIYTDFLGLDLDELTASAREKRAAASSVPAAASTPPAESTPEPTPASGQKPARPGFWARLLRREPPAEEESKSEEPAPEPAPVTMEEPLAIANPAEEEEPVKPARKSFANKPVRQTTVGKKKQTLSRPSKR